MLNRRIVLSMTFASLAGLAVAGCSDGSSPTQADAAADGLHAEQSAFPVTIEHNLGSTIIESAPKRIAAGGIGDADVLLALGLTPDLVHV